MTLMRYIALPTSTFPETANAVHAWMVWDYALGECHEVCHTQDEAEHEASILSQIDEQE